MFQKPPYTITEKAADLLAKIVEAATRLELGTDFKRDIRLHRENRVRTIHSSLAIEGNSLSLSEVTAVLEGKVVAGKQTEIKEVKNAYEAYDKIMTFDPYNINDFLNAHRLMTNGLVKESGKFRSGDVGVFDGDTVVHIGARPQFVPQLMADLFAWAKESELHPVLKSAIVHYEIETIHPFEDGNGRMGRLWQTLILAKWNPIFAWIPMESVLYENRPHYYEAIEQARKVDDSGAFIEFTLSAILDTITLQVEHQVKHQVKHAVEHQVELSDIQYAVLKSLEYKSLSRKEIFAAIRRNGDSRSFKRIVEPLIATGLVEMTVPDKPNSRLQKYRLTHQGKMALKENMP
ncbi:MAG: Fic/DOC family protein [Spirochaetes bacterium ADurb.Bin110]|jgi:Fic family protein|nr:MAG: Fic/DOC family protein [Spirochaetes bacterium ADurb.Bin110]